MKVFFGEWAYRTMGRRVRGEQERTKKEGERKKKKEKEKDKRQEKKIVCTIVKKI